MIGCSSELPCEKRFEDPTHDRQDLGSKSGTSILIRHLPKFQDRYDRVDVLLCSTRAAFLLCRWLCFADMYGWSGVRRGTDTH